MTDIPDLRPNTRAIFAWPPTLIPTLIHLRVEAVVLKPIEQSYAARGLCIGHLGTMLGQGWYKRT
jgi:hypothetical protein